MNETRFSNIFIEKQVLFYAWSPKKSGFVWIATLFITSKKIKIKDKNIFLQPVFRQAILI